MFSLARNNSKTPRDFKKSMIIVKKCIDIIHQCRYNPLYNKQGSLKFWALECSTGFLRQFLGLPAFQYEPYEFGDFYSKSTDVWGYFNIPKKTMNIAKNDSFINDLINKDRFKKFSDKKYNKILKDSITPLGFSNSFFNSNK